MRVARTSQARAQGGRAWFPRRPRGERDEAAAAAVPAGSRGQARSTAAPAATFSPRFLAGAALCALTVMLWRATQSYPTGVFDFYPLYYGAKAWLHTGNA